MGDHRLTYLPTFAWLVDSRKFPWVNNFFVIYFEQNIAVCKPFLELVQEVYVRIFKVRSGSVLVMGRSPRGPAFCVGPASNSGMVIDQSSWVDQSFG